MKTTDNQQPSEYAMRAATSYHGCPYTEDCVPIWTLARHIDKYAIAPAVAERDRRIAELEDVLRDIGAYKGEGGPGTPWRDIVRDVGAQARAVLAKHGGPHE